MVWLLSSRVVRALTLSALLLSITACGDDSGVNAVAPVSDEEPQPANDEEPLATETPERPTPPDEENIPAEPCCMLVPATSSTEIDVENLGDVTLGVFLIERETHEAVVNREIDWSISGPASGRLSATRSITNQDGLAEIRFNAGDQIADFTVTAQFSDIEPVTFVLSVLEPALGALLVRTVNPEAHLYDVSPIEIALYERATFRCEWFERGERPAGAMGTVELFDTSESAHIEALDSTLTYTIVATGFGDLGEIAATACVDEISVSQGRTSEVEVVLELLPLGPQGTYELTTHWDFSEAVSESGDIGSTLVDALAIFEDPGAALTEYALDALEGAVTDWVGDLAGLFILSTGLDVLIADEINATIDANESLRNLFSLGCDLRRMITRLEVGSLLEVGKLGSDLELVGTDTWTSVGVCDFTPDPDFEVGACDEAPDCERVGLSVDDLAGEPDSAERQPFVGHWRGTVVDYNQLVIGEHALDMNYGALIMEVLESIVLPALTGEEGRVTLTDYMLDAIDCDSLAESITGGAPICMGVCVETDDLAGFCEGAVSIVFGTMVEGFMSDLSLDAVVTVEHGVATLVNDDTDLEVERLLEGHFDGNLTVLDAAPFEASFEGVRVEDE